jgi:putative copper export protein
MVTFGLAVLALLVLVPGLGRVPRGTGYGAGIGLLVAAGGSLILIVVGASGVQAAAGATTDYLAYATVSRSGVLLAVRLVLALLAGLLAVGLTRSNQPARALAVAGLAAAGEIGLIAAGGHAAAFSSPLPVVVDIVHVGSASIWLGGLVALGGLTDFGGRPRLAQDVLRGLIRRFSAVALVSIALVTATGVYAAWIEIGDFSAIRSAYDLNLVVKIGVFVLAVAIGALNYLDGGRDRSWLGGLSKRILLELSLAVAVVVIAANLTSGSPTGTDRPIALDPAPSSTVVAEPVGLSIEPGRPGPNRYSVSLSTAPAGGTTVELDLARQDGVTEASSLPLQADPADPSGRTQVADMGQLPADSEWQAIVVISGSDGSELSRERFSFALDSVGISAGRATPPIDPILVVALALLLGSLLGTALTLAGRSLPRTLRETSRPAVLGGSLVGGVLGVALLIGGTPR